MWLLLNSNNGLTQIRLDLHDNQSKTIQLQEGFYLFVNWHVMGTLQLTVFTVLVNFDLHSYNLIPNPSVSIVLDKTTRNCTFTANGFCAGQLFRFNVN